MKIYRPRGISKSQLVLVTVLGVVSGVYIWRPLFDDFFLKKKAVVEPVNPDRP